jgi:uncharacterized membrane protein
VSSLFNSDQQARINSTVKEAELQTSGEVRVYIEKSCPEDVLDRSAFLFEKMDMHKTALRNGVLFYLATDDRKFAIIGDAGINSKVPSDFWNKIKEEMVQRFKSEEFTEGLCNGIKMAGEALKTYFPYSSGDKNELSDEIVFGEDR